MKILYFAWLRQTIGLAEEEIERPSEVGTPGELIDWLMQRSPAHAAAFENRESIRIAIDQAFAEPDDALADAREVAFFPPVTGG